MAVKLGSAGRFGIRYGQSVRKRIFEIESKQKKKQPCIFCPGIAKRVSKGIWLCKSCGKKFAGHAYFLEKQELVKTEEEPVQISKKEKKEKAKALKNEKSTIKEEKPKKARKAKTKSSEKTEENKQ